MLTCICGKPAVTGRLFTDAYKSFQHDGAEYVRCLHGTATLGPQLLRRLRRSARDRGAVSFVGLHSKQDATLVRLGLAEHVTADGFEAERIVATDHGRQVLAACGWEP